MVTIRQMSMADLPLCRHLVEEAGWNQLDTDWLRAMEMQPDGCFVAEVNGVPVATTTTCCFGDVAWIAMVLVDKQMRGRGIAKQLLEHAIAFLDHLKMATIRLDATVFGQSLYQKLGFKDEYEVIRFAGIVNGSFDIRINLNQAQDAGKIAKLDRQITGTHRQAFLQNLLNAVDCPFFEAMEMAEIVGYAGCRQGRNAIQIGPVAAMGSGAGISLLNAVASCFQGKKAYIDIPVQNIQAVSWAESHGFTEQRRFVRMYRGTEIHDFPEQIWASSGPEKG
ncbi:GNAT family N-acetyltransferase [Dyadobacter sp. CY323]|uniref:GNAT family N-acetyltransferase n=1 Tax=Dyadobacter sp. CY323 TaxID=2907302 RepID=UPI001F328F94|nr:GNAT family N-acetyltransferase [Dyadobacter sp. CY323]MCE6988022.1 GNAT family N-acetyltransferase [Dyadobacter sp. CY323]